MGGAPDGVSPALAQARREDVPGASRDREEGVIAPDAGIPVVESALLGEAVRLADRRVEIDREGSIARSRSRCPGPGEEMPSDGVELADVAPAEAAQERPERRGGLCLLYTSPSPRDRTRSRMPSSA